MWTATPPLCVCVCVINSWHLNWTPSTAKVLNQFDKFAFFGLQEQPRTAKKKNKNNNRNARKPHERQARKKPNFIYKLQIDGVVEG